MAAPGFDDMDADGDAEAEEALRDYEAYERTYAEDQSWKELREDASGRLLAPDVAAQQREKRRRHMDTPAARIRRGMIRYLYLVIDFSRAAAEGDLRPSRMAVMAALVESFVREFFDQNPLSHLALAVLRDGVAAPLTELSGSPDAHVRALRASMECSGDASLQNALELVRGALDQVPAYGYREVVVLYAALNTCDPGDVTEAIQRCRDARVRCSVVGLAAEIYICRQLAERTGGTYTVALDEHHLRELVLEHAPPPPALAESAAASLVRMGFPVRSPDDVAAICSCHLALRLGGAYTCPRCRARVCELPTECHVCGLTLVSSPHLARSYHHLFPVPLFEEVNLTLGKALPGVCFGCQSPLPLHGGVVGGVRVKCPRCQLHFCFDCDVYIHESLHNCPGCESHPFVTTKVGSSKGEI